MEHVRIGEGEGEGQSGQLQHHNGRGGGDKERVETVGTSLPEEDEQAAAARRGVGLACNFCRRSHTICETKRPCTRCEKAGRAHLCSDVPLRKRGRPRRTDSAAKDNDNNNNKLTHAQHQHKQRQPPPSVPAAAPLHNQPPLFTVATTTTTTTTANAPLGLDALPFYTISPRTPPAVTVRPSPAAAPPATVQAIAPKPLPPPKPTLTAPSHSSNTALFTSALDMVSDELRRARDENEKLRAKLRKTKAKLKHKKAEAKQLRLALAQEIGDTAARRRQELALVAAASQQQQPPSPPPRITATPASMHAGWSSSSPSDASTVSPHSSHSSPSSTSGSGSGSGSFVSSPLPVSSYSTHAFPIAVMEHVHQCLPFLSAYLFSPRDFVVQDLRRPMLAFDMGNVMDPTITYANPALCQLLGFSPRPGFPLMQLWADSKNCEKQMPLLMETQPPLYMSEFIFADPLLRCANGFHVRASFLMQFFFDRRGRIKYGVACAESWRADVPREGESIREWNEALDEGDQYMVGALDDLVAAEGQPFLGSSGGSFAYAADHFPTHVGGWAEAQDHFGGGDHLTSNFMEEVTFALRS